HLAGEGGSAQAARIRRSSGDLAGISVSSLAGSAGPRQDASKDGGKIRGVQDLMCSCLCNDGRPCVLELRTDQKEGAATRAAPELSATRFRIYLPRCVRLLCGIGLGITKACCDAIAACAPEFCNSKIPVPTWLVSVSRKSRVELSTA